MVEGDDALTQTRLDVAEMKGMLTQALSDHGQRISNIERDNITLHTRLSDKGKILARHDERLDGAEQAINKLENDNAARYGRILGTIGSVIAVVSLGLAILNRITL